MNAPFAILIAAIAFSFYPILNAIALERTSPFFLALLVQIATVGASFIALLIKIKSPTKFFYALREYLNFPLNTLLIPVFSGIGIYLGAIFFIFSLSLMSKAGASLVMESWPILAIFLAVFLPNKGHQIIRLRDYALMAVSMIGLLMITASEKGITLSEFLNNPFFLFNDQDFKGYMGIISAFLAAWCFAASSIARSYFASEMPESFRVKFFGKKETISEAIFTYLLTYILGLPLAVLSFIFLEDSIAFDAGSLLPITLLGVSLTITSALYSYAMLITTNSNINLLWYISPVLAALWLAFLEYSKITEMLIAGGGLIIIANIILILTSREKPKERL